MPAPLQASDPHSNHADPALTAVLFATVAVMHAPRVEAGRGAASLKYLADATDAVVLVDVAKGRKSPVFLKGFELATDKLPILATIKLDKIETVIAGHVSSNEVVVILEGNVDALAAEAKKRSTATATHAGVTYWITPDGEVGVIAKRLVIASPKTFDAVIDRAADKKRSRGPARVRTWLAAGQTSAALVIAAMPDARVAKDLSKRLGGSPQFATLSVGTTSNLTVDARAQFPGRQGPRVCQDIDVGVRGRSVSTEIDRPLLDTLR